MDLMSGPSRSFQPKLLGASKLFNELDQLGWIKMEMNQFAGVEKESFHGAELNLDCSSTLHMGYMYMYSIYCNIVAIDSRKIKFLDSTARHADTLVNVHRGPDIPLAVVQLDAVRVAVVPVLDDGAFLPTRGGLTGEAFDKGADGKPQGLGEAVAESFVQVSLVQIPTDEHELAFLDLVRTP